jgi:hypothetical protein
MVGAAMWGAGPAAAAVSRPASNASLPLPSASSLSAPQGSGAGLPPPTSFSGYAALSRYPGGPGSPHAASYMSQHQQAGLYRSGGAAAAAAAAAPVPPAMPVGATGLSSYARPATPTRPSIDTLIQQKRLELQQLSAPQPSPYLR